MHNDVIQFWFEEIEPNKWFEKDQHFDKELAFRFKELHKKAQANELYQWRNTAEGSLAEIIILDQFSRNIYRDTSKSFACDPQALTLAQLAIAKGFDLQLPVKMRGFIYLPFMHSESLIIHQIAEQLYVSLGDKNSLDFEMKHKSIIEQFGRYPHRNTILNRISTEEEISFLNQPNSGF